MDFEKRYKSAVESNPEDPPEMLWDSIQEELDLEAVWFRLEHSLAETRKIPLWAYQVAAASIALLFIISAWLLWPDENTIAPLAQSDLVQEEPAEKSPENILPGDTPGEISVQAENKNPLTFSEPILAMSEPRIDLVTEVEIKEMLEVSNYLTAIEAIYQGELARLEDSPPVIEKTSRSLEEEFLASLDPEPQSQRFSIGITGQFANTWLVNGKTLSGLQSYELTTTQATFGKSIGLSLIKPLNHKFSLKGDLMVFSQSRQNYNEYISGRYTSTSLQLDYSSISLMLSLRPGKPGSPHAIQFGAYAGSLIQAREVKGQNMLTVREDYSRADMGLIGGYEFSFPVSENIFLGTGFYAKYGLTNAFSGNQQIPDYLNRTHNAAFIFSISVNYSVN